MLGYKALQKSDYYFRNILPSIVKAENKGKNINQKKSLLGDAEQKHIEVLEKLGKDIPDAFVWQPEKSRSTTLYLKKAILDAINTRKKAS